MHGPGGLSAATLAEASLWLATLFYLLTLAPLLVALRRQSTGSRGKLDHLPALLGLGAHVAGLILKGVTTGRLPVGNLHESLSFLALLLASAYVIASFRAAYPIVEIGLLGLVLIFSGLSHVVPQDASSLERPALRSLWFAFHTMSAFFGLAALLLTLLASILYLLSERKLKAKRPGGYLRFLPALETCDRVSHRLLVVGLPVLTVGIVSGIGRLELAKDLSWGIKEVFFLLAWLIYAVLYYQRSVKGLRGRRAALVVVMASAVALIAVFGIRV